MPRWAVAIVTALATAVVLVAGVVVVRTVVGSTRLLESRAELGCQVDTTASGYQGWCLERVSRPELLLVPGRREIHLVPRFDGADGGRMLSYDDPFDDDADLAVQVTESEVRIIDPVGIAFVIENERIESLATD